MAFRISWFLQRGVRSEGGKYHWYLLDTTRIWIMISPKAKWSVLKWSGKRQNLRCGGREWGWGKKTDRDTEVMPPACKEHWHYIKFFLNEHQRNSTNITIKESECEHPKHASWLADCFFIFCSSVTIPFPKCLIPNTDDASKLLWAHRLNT